MSLNYIFEQVKHFFLTEDLSVNTNAVQTASRNCKHNFSGFTNSLLAFVFSIYVLLDKDRLGRQTKRILYSVGGTKIGAFIIHVGHLIDFYFFNFVKGQLLDAVIIGVMTFVSMFVFRMPYATMISVLVGFSDLIPIVGPIIGAAIGFIFILIDSPFQAMLFLILMVVLQQIQGNIIYPKNCWRQTWHTRYVVSICNYCRWCTWRNCRNVGIHTVSCRNIYFYSANIPNID